MSRSVRGFSSRLEKFFSCNLRSVGLFNFFALPREYINLFLVLLSLATLLSNFRFRGCLLTLKTRMRLPPGEICEAATHRR